MKFINLKQNSPAWLKWRQQGMGSSDAASVMGSGFQTAEELVRSKTEGLTIPENERMARGKLLEPVARVLYTSLTGIHCRPVCVTHDKYPWLRASLDGLSEDNRIVLEIKCPSDKAHWLALQGRIPSYYWPQVQHQLAVTGLQILHYWSYTDRSTFAPHQRAALVLIQPDERYIEQLIERERALLEQIRPPRRKGRKV